MQAASSSRARKSRTQRESSDAIEDGGSSRKATQDEVMEDDERPRPKGKGKGKAKVKSERGQVPTVNEEDILGDIADQPLDRQQMQKLQGLAQDWSTTRQGIHVTSFNLAIDVASALAEFGEGEDAEKDLIEIDNIMRKLLDVDNVLESHRESLSKIHQQVARGEPVHNVVDRYKEGYEALLEQYEHKTSRQKYAKNTEYVKFREAIYEVKNPGQAAPPLTDVIPRENGDDSDDEDDIQIGGITQDYRCPLSLTILENPLTSRPCGHSYSSESIIDFMRTKSSVQCPATGCNQRISRADLYPDKELAKRAKEAARRERLRDDDDSDEDVVE